MFGKKGKEGKIKTARRVPDTNRARKVNTTACGLWYPPPQFIAFLSDSAAVPESDRRALTKPMHKTSAKRREEVRRSRQKHPVDQATPEARKYFREYARRNKHKRNEVRRARRHRHGQRNKVPAREAAERFAGMSFVAANWLHADRTRWIGPGSRKSRELEKEGDIFLMQIT